MDNLIKVDFKNKKKENDVALSFADRIERVRKSLERINELMGELKKRNEEDKKT